MISNREIGKNIVIKTLTCPEGQFDEERKMIIDFLMTCEEAKFPASSPKRLKVGAPVKALR